MTPASISTPPAFTTVSRSTIMGNVIESDEIKSLTHAELQEAWAIGERLAVEATRLMAAVAPEHRKPYALARYLGADRSGCQRLYSAVADVDEGTLARSPGPRALIKFAEAVKASGLEPSVADNLMTIAAQLEAFLKATGGNQRAYEKRLVFTRQHKAASETGAQPRTPDPYEQNFLSTRELLGRSSECMVRVLLVAPSKNVEGTLDLVGTLGHVGHVQHSDNIPPMYTTIHNIRSSVPLQATPNSYGTLAPGLSAPNFIIREFSSPWWRISEFADQDARIRTAEAEASKRQAPGDLFSVDATFGLAPDPRFYEHGSQDFRIGVNYPCRRLIYDVYLHSELAAGSTYTADAHISRDLARPGQEHLRWLTRIGQPAQLILLGSDLASAASDAYTRQRDLIEYLFRAVNWNVGDFVGFRYDVRYPLWHAHYRILFKYAPRL